MTIYAKYIGDGLSVAGVPARGLTKDEYERHREAIEACAVKLYEVAEPKKKKASEKEDDD